jgi:hypothetical protein
VALGGGAAFGYWNLTQSNPAHAVANSLGQGATPSAVVSPPNSNSVTITFAQVTTVSGGVEIPASDYIVRRLARHRDHLVLWHRDHHLHRDLGA